MSPAAQLTQERSFLLMLKQLLERAYQDGIDQFYNWSIKGNTLSGVFRDGASLFRFQLSDRGLSYQPIRASERGDEPDIPLPVLRTDAKRPKKCTPGKSYACGGACLPNSKVCRINQRRIVKPEEFQTLMRSAREVQLRQAGVSPATAKETAANATPPKKELKDMTIRELRKEAQDRGVPGYSHVDKQTLRNMIEAWDATPEDQRKILKSIEKQKKERDADPLKDFKRFFGLQKYFRRVNSTASIASLVTAAGLIHISYDAYQRVRENYRGNFSTSAATAENMSTTIKVENVKKSNEYITFAVDRLGSRHTGTLKDELLKADPKFFGKHHIVTTPANEENPASKVLAKAPKGVRDTVENYTATMHRLSQQVLRGRDPQSIDLAAQVMAYHRKYPDKEICLIGDHDGGMVVNEAAEILFAANKDLASRLRIVNVGTPSFGLTEAVTNTPESRDKDKKTRVGSTLTLTSRPEPFHLFPGINQQQINSVKGDRIQDYLKDSYALDRIRGGLGAYDKNNRPDVPGYRYNPKDPDDPGNLEGFDQMPIETQVTLQLGYMKRKQRQQELENPQPPKTRKQTPAQKARQEMERAAPKAATNRTQAIKQRQKKQQQSTQPPPKTSNEPDNAPGKPASPPRNQNKKTDSIDSPAYQAAFERTRLRVAGGA